MIVSRVLFAGAVSLMLCVPRGGGPLNAVEARDVDPPTLVSGVAPEGAVVQVSIRPTGEFLSSVPLGQQFVSMDVETHVEGDRFVASLAPEQVPEGYQTEDGRLNLSITATSPDGHLWGDAVSVQEADSATGLPVWAPAIMSSWDASNARRTYRSGVSVGRLTSLGRRAKQIDAKQDRREVICADSVINRNVVNARVGNSYPVGNTTSWMRVDSSMGGRYGVAIKHPGQDAYRSGTLWASGGWGSKWAENGATRGYRVGVEYATIQHRYRDTYGNCVYTYISFEPTVETGGSGTVSINRPNWSNIQCTGVTKDSVWRRTRTDGEPYSWSYGVNLSSIVGFDVSVAKQYDPQNQVVAYRIRGSKEMCGKGAWPAVAPDQYERFR